MLDRFLAFAKENKLFEKGDSVLVGVSGGVDSVVLLDILAKTQSKMKLEIAVAHVNYGLRKDSDRDHRFAKDLAKKHSLPFFDKKVQLTGSNIEEKARDIRYDFFRETAKKKGFSKIAVAHHKNDLVETFFLNLSRGSGLAGLVSMKPKTNLDDSPHTWCLDSRLHGNDKRKKVRVPFGLSKCYLIRPLLFATRREVEDYAEKNGLDFVEDTTNKDLKFKRNLIRHKVIPELEKINPELVETVSAEVEDLREVQKIVTEITDKYYKKLAKENAGATLISVKELSKVNPYLQSEILRESIRRIKGDLRDISRKNIEDILALSKNLHGTKEAMLPQGLIARRVYDRLEVRKYLESPAQKQPGSIRLIAGKKAVFGKWRLFLEAVNKKTPDKNKNLVFLDIKKTPTLLVRCRKPGDRINIGRGKTKTLQDVFVDAKVPKDERAVYPVLVNDIDEIVWIPGIRVADGYQKDVQNLVCIKATLTKESL